jgi:hypothetical protein
MPVLKLMVVGNRSTRRAMTRRRTRMLGVVMLGGVLAVAVASPVAAQVKSKVQRDNGRFVAFDPEAETVTVKVKGKDTVFQVKAEGSVLKRTTVSLNASPGKLGDLPNRAPVIVYWVPCDDKGANCKEQDKRLKYARKIDAPKIPKAFQDDIDALDN